MEVSFKIERGGEQLLQGGVEGLDNIEKLLQGLSEAASALNSRLSTEVDLQQTKPMTKVKKNKKQSDGVDDNSDSDDMDQESYD